MITVLITRENNQKQTSEMEKAFKYGPMVRFTKAIGRMTMLTVKAELFTMTEITTKDNLREITLMDTANTSLNRMEQFTKDIR